MYHIVFNANDDYIKYLAVLCHSIVKNAAHNNIIETMGGGGKLSFAHTQSISYYEKDNESIPPSLNNPDLSKDNTPLYKSQNSQIQNNPFAFHILTDGLKHETEQKLQTLELELNKLYPCKFHIYTLSDSMFHGLPKLNNNYLAYFRIKMASCLPKEIQKCLYLDVDMLCVADIREIFYKDLQGKICGVVLDAHYLPSRIMPGVNGGEGNGFSLNIDTYFNSGLMLIDLEQYRIYNIEQKCFEWLKCYIPTWFDQDVFNAILSNHLYILPLEWNFMLGHVENRDKSDFKGESEESNLIYTYQEYVEAKNNIKILHYLTTIKPWHALRANENGNIISCAYRNEWWIEACNTPIFDKELQILYIQRQESAIFNLSICLQKQIANLENLRQKRRPLKRLKQSLKRRMKKIFHK
ncbi:glycosyltransferase family 8 protein [Helicobacter bilis]|uniref:glycosyltransferase family 8 protein n=1 Tax=Helicobacter bilis TaxID=37372 RepID=UPI002A821852|nr:glycosyltransferase family 8 protein [Helicobacter bilis]MDY4399861.1 glycosyltransferase family 8 protein [Helicobacter bilis]